MPDPIILPPWDDDPLSKYLADAEHNTRASAANWPDVYGVQKDANALVCRVLDAIENERQDSGTIGAPRMLIHRSHGAILATMRLTMSGQAIEAMPTMRLAIEEVWYALHIAKDPAPPARAKIWWNRDDSLEAIDACRKEFSVGNVRRNHEALDPQTAASMKRLYEDTITYGGHPNSSGVALGVSLEEGADADPLERLRVDQADGHREPHRNVDGRLKRRQHGQRGRIQDADSDVRRLGLGQDFNALRKRASKVFQARALELRREHDDSARARPE